MRTLRTPDVRFAGLPDFGFAPRYADVPDDDGGTLRMGYIDEQQLRKLAAKVGKSSYGQYLIRLAEEPGF